MIRIGWILTKFTKQICPFQQNAIVRLSLLNRQLKAINQRQFLPAKWLATAVLYWDLYLSIEHLERIKDERKGTKHATNIVQAEFCDRKIPDFIRIKTENWFQKWLLLSPGDEWHFTRPENRKQTLLKQWNSTRTMKSFPHLHSQPLVVKVNLFTLMFSRDLKTTNVKFQPSKPVLLRGWQNGTNKMLLRNHG